MHAVDVVDAVLLLLVELVVFVDVVIDVAVVVVVVAVEVVQAGLAQFWSTFPCDQFSDAKNFFPLFERRMHLPSGFTSQYTQPCAVAHLRAQSFGCHVVLSGAVAGSSSSSRLPLK